MLKFYFVGQGLLIATKCGLFAYLPAILALRNLLGVVQKVSDIDGTTTLTTTKNMSKVSPITNNIYLRTLRVNDTAV